MSRTAHIISNAEITTTECGRMLAVVPATDDVTPQPMASGDDVAVWDNAAPPAGHMICPPCFVEYTAATSPAPAAHLAPCGEDFDTEQDAKDHEATCGQCAGAVEPQAATHTADGQPDADDDGPADFSLDSVVEHLTARGVSAYVEQTGGGTATIYAGRTWTDTEDGYETTRHAAVAGPGWFEGPAWTKGTGRVGDFYVGADDDGEGDVLDMPEDLTPEQAVAWAVLNIEQEIARDAARQAEQS